MVQTAERCSQNEASDNAIYQRHVFAYEQAALLAQGKIAEFGCGEGYGMNLLLPKADVYLAMDKFPTAIGEEITDKVIFKQMKFPKWGGVPQSYFDFVVTFQVIEHINEDSEFTMRLSQLLKPGGKLILTTPNIKTSLTRNPFHVREYTHDQLEKVLAPYFTNLDMQGVFLKERSMAYYQENKASVEKFKKLDPLDLEHKLPAWMLRKPYDLLNRWNRRKLLNQSQNSANSAASEITTEDFYLDKFNDSAIDFFVIAQK